MSALEASRESRPVEANATMDRNVNKYSTLKA